MCHATLRKYTRWTTKNLSWRGRCVAMSPQKGEVASGESALTGSADSDQGVLRNISAAITSWRKPKFENASSPH